jgi:hypothetical protein
MHEIVAMGLQNINTIMTPTDAEPKLRRSLSTLEICGKNNFALNYEVRALVAQRQSRGLIILWL